MSTFSENVGTRHRALVQNRISEGYRRAGIGLHKGENLLENLTDAQLIALKADHRLVVKETEQASSEMGDKGLSDNGANGDEQKLVRESALPADLTTLTAEQLKNALIERGITFNKSANKAELIALLKAGE